MTIKMQVILLAAVLTIMVTMYVVYQDFSQQPTASAPVSGAAFPAAPLMDRGSTSVASPVVGTSSAAAPRARTLTAVQRSALIASAQAVGDEGAYLMDATPRYRLWYSAVDDSFVIVFTTIDPTAADRAAADKDLAGALNVPETQVCDYKVQPAATSSLYELGDDVMHWCPR